MMRDRVLLHGGNRILTPVAVGLGAFAGTLRNTGKIEASGIGTDAAGNIVLTALADVTLEGTSVVGASGASAQDQSPENPPAQTGSDAADEAPTKTAEMQSDDSIRVRCAIRLRQWTLSGLEAPPLRNSVDGPGCHRACWVRRV